MQPPKWSVWTPHNAARVQLYVFTSSSLAGTVTKHEPFLPFRLVSAGRTSASPGSAHAYQIYCDLQFSLVIFNYTKGIGQAVRSLCFFIHLVFQFCMSRSITLHTKQIRITKTNLDLKLNKYFLKSDWIRSRAILWLMSALLNSKWTCCCDFPRRNQISLIVTWSEDIFFSRFRRQLTHTTSDHCLKRRACPDLCFLGVCKLSAPSGCH